MTGDEYVGLRPDLTRHHALVLLFSVIIITSLTCSEEASPTPSPTPIPIDYTSGSACQMPFPVTGGVIIDDNAVPLNAALMDCSSRPYINIVHYLEEGKAFYERTDAFYGALSEDLGLLTQVLGIQCAVCNQVRNEFITADYSHCGSGLELATTSIVDPKVCGIAARDRCSGSSSSCVLCENIPERKGHDCDSHDKSLPAPVKVLECSRMVHAINDVCTFGKNANVCELAKTVEELNGYLAGTVIPILPELADIMDDMAGRVREATASGLTPERIEEDLQRFESTIGASFTTDDYNITSFQTEMRAVIATLADPSVFTDIGRGEGPARTNGVGLTGGSGWKDHCRQYAAGPCFDREPVTEDDEDAEVCRYPNMAACEQRSPSCKWMAGACKPSCKAWLAANAMQCEDDGCSDRQCSGRGGSGVAHDCQYCCEPGNGNETKVIETVREGDKTPIQQSVDYIQNAVDPAGIFVDEEAGYYDYLPSVFGPPMGFFTWLVGEPEDIVETFTMNVPGAGPPGMPMGGGPSWCGSCGVEDLSYTLSIPNLDRYNSAATMVVATIAGMVTEEIFVGDGACLAYNTPHQDCSVVCMRCHGSTASHCHAQAGVCVCEAGTGWTTTHAPCTTIGHSKQLQALGCCSRLFNTTMALDWTRPPLDPDMECLPLPEQLPSPFFDRCQTVTSPTGMCCYDGFEEEPITAECLALGPTCEVACLDRFPSNATLQVRCVERCRDAPIHENAVDPTIQVCRRQCRQNDGTETCERMCHALAPDLEVVPAILRSGRPVRALYMDGMVRAGVTVRNRGLLPITGSLAVDLRILSDCDCIECGTDDKCDCQCDERIQSLTANRDLGTLQSDATVSVMTQPFIIASDLVNTSFFPKGEVRGPSGIIGRGEGELCAVFTMENITVLDVYFTTPSGERVTKVYSGETVVGVVELATTEFPLTGLVVALDEDGPVQASISNMTVSGPGTYALKTEPFELTDLNVGGTIEMGADLLSGGSLVLSARFQSQGPVVSACNADNMTVRCNDNVAYLRSLYQDASLEVVRAELAVRNIYFTDDVEQNVNRLFNEDWAQGHAIIVNTEPIGFTGEITLRVLNDEGVYNDAFAMEQDISLASHQSISLSTPLFTAQAGEGYQLLVQAETTTGLSWLDLIGNNKVFPYARLDVGLLDLSHRSGKVATTISTDSCNRALTCEDCAQYCSFSFDPQSCEMIAGDCSCGCIIS